MINLDVAWGVQIGILQAREAAEIRGLDGDRVKTWMTRPMWNQLIREVELMEPGVKWQPVKDHVPGECQRMYCGSPVVLMKGKKMIAVSLHPKLLK